MADKDGKQAKEAKQAKVQAGLEDYVEVHQRITKFKEQFPEGSLQSEIVESTPAVLIVKAYAYRTPDDRRPGIGHASEPVPGQTPYTKDSELMNGETSAWGRALAALGIEVNRGIASGNEVRARTGGTTDSGEPASDGQIDFLLGKGKRPGLFERGQLGTGQRHALVYFACGQDELTKAGASKLITALKEDPEKGAAAVLEKLEEAAAGGDAAALKARALITDDVPADTADLDAKPDGQQALEGTPLDDGTLQPDTDAEDEPAK